MIDTAGPAPVWGGGGGPPPGPADVTLVAANTFLENGNRDGSASGGAGAGDQVWYYRASNTIHDPLALTQSNGYRVNITGQPDLFSLGDQMHNAQLPGPPFPGAPTLEGTVTVPHGVPSAAWNLNISAGYAVGVVGTDEQYKLELWRLS